MSSLYCSRFYVTLGLDAVLAIRASLVAQMVKNPGVLLLAMRETWV